MTSTNNSFHIILPPALKKGDTFGLVAPAGSWDNDAFEEGARLISELGFQVRFPHNINKKETYLAGKDSHRSALFNETWQDPEVKALLAVRGGYGSLRILSSIDYNMIKSCPKIFIGFSDITALHTAIFNQTGLVSFHGPMLTTLAASDKKTIRSFFETITRGEIAPIHPSSLQILQKGSTRGILAGGNLTTALHLLATPYEVPWQDKIIFLEDTGEAPYRIDRMLTHLKLAGRLENIRGLLLGSFTHCGDKEIIWKRVSELFEGTNIPIWADFPFGHGNQNMTMPIGLEASMDSSKGQLLFHGPCCRSTF